MRKYIFAFIAAGAVAFSGQAIAGHYGAGKHANCDQKKYRSNHKKESRHWGAHHHHGIHLDHGASQR